MQTITIRAGKSVLSPALQKSAERPSFLKNIEGTKRLGIPTSRTLQNIKIFVKTFSCHFIRHNKRDRGADRTKSK